MQYAIPRACLINARRVGTRSRRFRLRNYWIFGVTTRQYPTSLTLASKGDERRGEERGEEDDRGKAIRGFRVVDGHGIIHLCAKKGRFSFFNRLGES